MIKKNETCLYCGEKMESKTAKKKFCSTLHRVYYNRELERKLEDVLSNPENKEETGKLIKDLVLNNVAISKVTKKEKKIEVKRIAPNSEEGRKAEELSKDAVPERITFESILKKAKEGISKEEIEKDMRFVKLNLNQVSLIMSKITS